VFFGEAAFEAYCTSTSEQALIIDHQGALQPGGKLCFKYLLLGSALLY
jgi:hypothetical protein